MSGYKRWSGREKNTHYLINFIKHNICVLCAPLAFFINTSLSAALLYHPSLRWYTLKSEHFYIHFHSGEEDIARVTAAYAEDIHERLAGLLNWKPSSRTHLVIDGTTDFANGMATTFPYNTIFINSSPPELDSVIGYYDDWLYILIAHEYTHILQLDQAHGPAKIIRLIFGRTPFTLLPPFTAFPNALMPEWLIEGIATYEESRLTGAGRIKSTLMRSILDASADENTLPSIGTGNGDPIAWLWHSYPYFYGGAFYRYLSDNYGEGAVAGLHNKYSGQLLPFFLNTAGYSVTGKGLSALWDEWVADIKIRYNGPFRHGDGSVKKLTSSGYFTRGPRFSPSGRYLLYSTVNPYEYPAVRMLDLTEGKDKRLIDRNYGIDYGWSPSEDGFYFTQAEVYKTYFTYNDLYFYSLEEDKISRLTMAQRLTEIDVSPDGEHLVGISLDKGARRLVFMNIRKQAVEYMTGNDWTEGYYNPRFSPHGIMTVFVVWKRDGSHEIGIMNNTDKLMKILPLPAGFHLSPTWHPSGRGILFSSDFEGSQALYFYSIEEGKLFRAGSLSVPAYEFTVSPDGSKIIFSGYTAEGFDLFEMEFRDELLEEVSMQELNSQVIELGPPPDKHELELSRYSALPSLLPRFWMPLVFYGSSSGWYLNAQTFNSDPLKRHSYSLSAEYYPDYGHAGIYIGYQNDILRPSIGFRYWYLPVRGTCTNCPQGIYWKRENGGKVFIEYLFRRFRYSIIFGIHYTFSRFTVLSDFRLRDDRNYAGAGGEFIYDNSKKYDWTPGRQDGRMLGFGIRRYHDQIGSDFNFYKATGDYREYIAMPGNSVMALRLTGGVIWDAKEEWTDFSIGGFLPRMEDKLFGLEDTELYLRGYPYDISRGRVAASGTLEFRSTLLRLDAGLWTLPLFFQKLHANIFLDSGHAWDERVSARDFRSSAGLEIKLDSKLAYIYNITLTLGLARGFNNGAMTQVYFWFGSAF